MASGGKSGEWWRGGTLYQIYPASFLDTNNDGWGDIAGIIRKLDYVRALGVDGYWLQSILPSPMNDHGYDVTDFRDVNPLFGSLEDFDRLLARTHDLGMRLVFEQCYGHTSNRHPWFIESRKRERNAKSDWYLWADQKADGTEPNNWRNTHCGPAWTWDHERAQYFMHHWLPSMPHLDYNNPQVQDELLDIARFWFERGVDGFRLDVVNTLIVDKELRSNPPVDGPPFNPLWAQKMIYDASRPENIELMRRLRQVAERHGGRFLVGEMYGERPLQDGMEYSRGGDRLHSCYHILGDSYHVTDGAASLPLAARLRSEIESWNVADAWPTWTFGTHDAPRVRTRLGGEHAPIEFAKVLMALLTCLRGTIMLPQGEELGLPAAHVPYHKRRDHAGVHGYPPAHDRDATRTPMPWTYGAPHAGFSSVEPWLPVDPRHEVLAVNAQEADPNSMLNWTRAWIALRHAHDALRHGEMRFIDAPDGAVAWRRASASDELVCAFNPSSAAVRIDARVSQVLLASAGVEVAGGKIELPAYGAAVGSAEARR